MKELHVKKKDNKPKLGAKKPHNLKWLELNNKWKSKRCSRNKPEPKKLNSKQPFASKGKSDNLSRSLSRKEKKFSRNTLLSSRSKLYKKDKSQSRIRSKKKLKTKRPNSCTKKRPDC